MMIVMVFVLTHYDSCSSNNDKYDANCKTCSSSNDCYWYEEISGRSGYLSCLKYDDGIYRCANDYYTYCTGSYPVKPYTAK